MARLVLLGPAAEAAGKRQDDVSATTVGGVVSWAGERYGVEFSTLLASCQIWVNGEACGNDQRIGPDDEVAVVPPFSGG